MKHIKRTWASIHPTVKLFLGLTTLFFVMKTLGNR